MLFSIFTPKTLPKGGVNRHFHARLAKKFKLLYYQNDWSDSNHILHSDKNHKMFVVDRPKVYLTNPKWRTAAIFKNVICDISAAVWLILTKFGTTMHIIPPNWWANKNLKIWKSKMVDGAILKMQESQYIRNHVANFDEMLHDDTY